MSKGVDVMGKNQDKDSIIRSVQTAASIIAVGLLTWVGTSLSELQKNAAASGVEISYIKLEVDAIKADVKNMSSFYTKDDAKTYKREVNSEFKDIKQRVRKLETRGKS